MSTTVGFSPVPQGNSVVTGGSTAVTASGDAAASPLGFIDALLGMLGAGVTLGGGETPAGDGNADAQASTDLGAIANAGLAVNVAIDGDLPKQQLATKTPEKLVSDLVAAMTAIDDAAAKGEPIDPALQKKLDDTLEEIAGMLGITLPQNQPTTLPNILAAVTGEQPTAADIELGGGLVMENKPLPEGYKLPVADDAAAKPDTALADDFLKAVEQASKPAPVDEEPETATTTPAKSTDDAEAIDPESPLGKLVAKLADLADKLDSRLPELTAKIEAIVQKLSSGTLDTDAMAKLQASIDAGDLDALLTPRAETSKPAPAAATFTAPTLPTPMPVATPPKQTAEAAKATEPAPAAKEPELGKVEERPVAKDTKPAERSEGEPKVRDRSFASHLAETRAEKLADQTSQTTQTPTTQVKTDLAVVAPKTVHAAYQAPMQAVNMPQVAYEIVRQVNQGNSRFQIRLDPPELGRIDVRMQVDGDGNVHARMTVERAETLDLMQRDQRSLEKALAQAGLDGSKTNLEFSLRQNPFARDGQGQQQGGNGSPYASRNDTVTSEEVPEIVTTTQYRGLASASGVNLFV